ncbi:MAG: sodium:proton antiporter [Bacteroidia bacterium]
MFLNATIFQTPPTWLIAPFIFLLLSIAVMPVLFAKFWHHYYKSISVGLGLLVMAYYILMLDNMVLPIESLAEYVSFISLLTILYVASGGIYIFADVESKVFTNMVFLLTAAVLTNFIGTTGASVLLIRPYLRLNRYRIQAYHVVFFIFMVSNLGGLLTPIGDPPLFMGFLKGIPFSWTIIHLFPQWLLANSLLLLVFYFFEKRNTKLDDVDNPNTYSNKIIINGKRNFVWLLLAVGTVFLDPNIIDGLPAIEFHGRKLSFLRELIQLSSAFLCFRFASKNALKSNDFDFEPIKEVAYLFFGIFLCMLPALQLLESFAHAQKDSLTLTPGIIYWFSGLFSSVLDNAPTYINVLTLILSSSGFSINMIADVQQFLAVGNIHLLEAVSVGSVFFGAMTYIGNGPNLMVKSIAENSGIEMPSFGAYIFKYSFPVLLPILFIVYIVFFAF